MGKCLITKLQGTTSNERLPRLGYFSFIAKKRDSYTPAFAVSGNSELISDKPVIAGGNTVNQYSFSGLNNVIKLTEDDTFICIKAKGLTALDTWVSQGNIKTEQLQGLYGIPFTVFNPGCVDTIDMPASCVTPSLVALNANVNINIDDFNVCENLTTLVANGNMIGSGSNSIRAIPSTNIVTFVVRGHSSFPMVWTDFSKFVNLNELQVDNITGNHQDLLNAMHSAGRTSGEIYLNGSHYTFSQSGWS